jgi:hypothetical protein
LAKNLVLVSVIFVSSHWQGNMAIVILGLILALIFVLIAMKNKNLSGDVKKILTYVIISAVINYLFINNIQFL